MVGLLGHRQPKGAATAKLDLQPPRHISTLPAANSPTLQLTRLKAAVGVGLPESERSRAPGPGLFCLQGLLQRVKTALFARASFS